MTSGDAGRGVPAAAFGAIDGRRDRVVEFKEKVAKEDERINGAFFVLEPGVFDYVDGDRSSFERGARARLAEDGRLMALWAFASAPRTIWEG